ncbi:MAG: beta-ACP synthase [Bacteroidales bacterium]|nr:beta-ACP synthase [Bacteroidales bacterium]
MTYLIADNIISSLGFTTSQNFEALKAARVGIKNIDDKLLYPEPFPASVVDTDELNAHFAKLNAKTPFARLEKMMILSIVDALGKTGVDIQSERTGIILSTTKGNIDLLGSESQSSFDQERVLPWRLGEVIGHYFGNPNRVEVLSNACISGVVALNTAAMLIKNGKYDNVVVCGGDIVSRFVVSGFMSFLSLSPTACKPFDEKRDGLSLGEAAGTIIVSNTPNEGQNIVWLGGASANDANHISGPSRTGEGSFIAIRKALVEAGIESRDIEHISAHGTATPYNDEMESIAISRHNMENATVNSLKGSWGHTLGAAGIIETIALAEEMRQNTLLKTAGFVKHGVSKAIHVINQTQTKELTTCLKMASGFGGSNAALVLGKLGSDGSRKSGVGSQNPAAGSRQSDNLTIEQSNHLTIEQSNHLTIEQSSHLTIEQSNLLTIQPSNNQAIPQPATRNPQPATRNPVITTCCHIKNNKVYLNGKLLFEDRKATDLNTFIKKAFRHFKPKYPKFFKMDDISKLGFLAAEIMLANNSGTDFKEEEIGVVLSNSQSTLITDSRFQESINEDTNFFPSPAVFVYTLPNIMIGEISIRHKLRGENAFFIFAAFNAGFLTDYINGLFFSRKIKACIGGWVDEKEEGYEAFMYWTTAQSMQENTKAHSAQEVNKLYNSIG